MMLFHEIYGSYYEILSTILSRAVDGNLKQNDIYEIIREKGFEETVLSIPEHLKDESWPLILPDNTTPIAHKPQTGLTTIEKRWLKTLLSDPRIRLFDPPAEGLEDVEPLYPPDAIVYFDRYADGDPYDNPAYIANFRTILRAMEEKRWLHITFVSHKGAPQQWRCIPDKLEYSAKDDKFRLLTCNNRVTRLLNIARITACTLGSPFTDADCQSTGMRQHTLVFELTDHRNALERCMMHFSHLEKETERLEDNRYRVTMRYVQEDESELVIRLLSFGQMVKVLSPEHLRQNIKTRIFRQLGLATQDGTVQVGGSLSD